MGPAGRRALQAPRPGAATSEAEPHHRGARLVQACVLANPDFVRPGFACARTGVRCATCAAAPGELDMLLQPQPSPAETARRGIVLLVVIAMLTLFAAVALSFAFYANTEAANSRTGRDALVRAQPDMDP